jgi:methionyl-tRNA formyltransferase
MMPSFWQMYHGEASVGLTIHFMVAKIDEGDVLFQDTQPILPNESLDHLIRRSKRHGAHCMAGVIQGLAEHSQTAKRANGLGSYFTFPTAQEIREFRRRGFRSI